jgi:hypothetical protein
MSDPDSPPGAEGIVSRTLHTIVSQVPASVEPATPKPLARAQVIAKSAALRAAALSGTMALPPGPLGLATVIPDLIAIWKLQQQLVADIAAVFGKTSFLTRETMVICLFRHGDALLTRGLFAHVGESILVRRVASRTLQQLLAKIAVRVTQRLAAKGLARWLPLLGALGVGAHAYYDTSHVAANAIELFSRNVELEPELEIIAEPVEAVKPPAARKPRAASKSAMDSPAARKPRPRSGAKRPRPPRSASE